MRTSINRRSAGFTLIELLAVLVLLGLGLGVGLSAGFDRSPQQQKQQALLLANTLELAAQDAVLDGLTLGLDFFADGERHGYRLLQLRAAEWVPLRDDAILFPQGMRAVLELGGERISPEPRVSLPPERAFAPEVTLLPTRELTPFTLTLAAGEDAPSVLSADLMGRIRVDQDAPPPP